MGRTFMTRHSSNKANNTWYLDFYILRHICNNKKLYSNIRSKNYKFIMVRGEIIYSQEINIVYLLLRNGKITMMLLNVVYISKYDFNLISLKQLCKLEILYHNHPNSMVLKQGRSIFKIANKYKNLFVLEIGSKKSNTYEKKR